MVSERTFGVEIECTYGQAPLKSGLRRDYEGRDSMLRRARQEIKAHKDFSGWAGNIGMDGSGVEIRSPILKGQDGIEEFKAFMDFLIEKGSSVTNQDGMHVHHGAKDYKEDGQAVIRLVKSWAEYTPVINKMVAPRRRRSNMCSANWTADKLWRLEQVLGKDAADLKAEYERQLADYRNAIRNRGWAPHPIHTSPDNIVGRGALNINGIWNDKGTVEIRLAEGMMCSDSAVAWVKFGQAFMESMKERQRPLACAADPDAVFRAINLDAEAKKVLKAKIENKGHALNRAAPGKIANGVEFDEQEDA